MMTVPMTELAIIHERMVDRMGTVTDRFLKRGEMGEERGRSDGVHAGKAGYRVIRFTTYGFMAISTRR